jgi:hypothetical protein
VKSLVTIVTSAILPVGSIPLGPTDPGISAADTSIPDSKITAAQTKASDSSAIAMIMGARITPSGAGGSNGL